MHHMPAGRRGSTSSETGCWTGDRRWPTGCVACRWVDQWIGDPAQWLSVIQAEDLNEALGVVQDHPYLARGRGYSIETYRLP